MLFTHEVTRFPGFVTCLTKADFAELGWHFQNGLMNTLLKVDAKQQQLDAAAKALSRLVCDNNCDRSVQGTMNQMKGDIEHLLWYDKVAITDLSVYRTGVWSADRPCPVKGDKDCVWPTKAMLTLLDNL